jgi:hypothetical protein
VTNDLNSHQTVELISLVEAARRGIERLRKPIWANPMDHVKIDIIDGRLGPWIHLYAPFNKECNGRDPVDLLIVQVGDINAAELEPYAGPLPDSDEYRAEVARFDGCMQGGR